MCNFKSSIFILREKKMLQKRTTQRLCILYLLFVPNHTVKNKRWITLEQDDECLLRGKKS